LKEAKKIARKNKDIDIGTLKDKYGAINANNETSHVDLFRYEGENPSLGFRIVAV